jgi:hypothetical protein
LKMLDESPIWRRKYFFLIKISKMIILQKKLFCCIF